jgi:creatinine amidohydrolase/Fe(II)-dependent formamide hydrolase-like protein
MRRMTGPALLGDIFSSLKSMGFGRSFIINSHGDGQHKRAVIQALLDAQKATGLDIRYLVSSEDIRQAGEWSKDARRVTPQGYVGDPAKYNKEEARAFVTEWCRMMAEAIASYMRKGHQD